MFSGKISIYLVGFLILLCFATIIVPPIVAWSRSKGPIIEIYEPSKSSFSFPYERYYDRSTGIYNETIYSRYITESYTRKRAPKFYTKSLETIGNIIDVKPGESAELLDGLQIKLY